MWLPSNNCNSSVQRERLCNQTSTTTCYHELCDTECSSWWMEAVDSLLCNREWIRFQSILLEMHVTASLTAIDDDSTYLQRKSPLETSNLWHFLTASSATYSSICLQTRRRRSSSCIISFSSHNAIRFVTLNIKLLFHSGVRFIIVPKVRWKQEDEKLAWSETLRVENFPISKHLDGNEIYWSIFKLLALLLLKNFALFDSNEQDG